MTLVKEGERSDFFKDFKDKEFKKSKSFKKLLKNAYLSPKTNYYSVVCRIENGEMVKSFVKIKVDRDF